MTTEIHSLAGAYVLDALDEVERHAFGRHLAECHTCALEVAELRETAARLADVTWSAPPPRLRTEVLAQVHRTRQLAPKRIGPERHAASPRWRGWVAAAAVAGILAAGAGVGAYAIQERRVRDQQRATAAAQELSTRIEAVLAAPDARLRGEPHPRGGRVTLVVSNSLDTGVAVLSGLPDPGIERSYQLWRIEGEQPISLGALPAGAAAATRLVTGMRTAAAFAVSLERAGGSPAPTAVTLSMPLT